MTQRDEQRRYIEQCERIGLSVLVCIVCGRPLGNMAMLAEHFAQSHGRVVPTAAGR